MFNPKFRAWLEANGLKKEASEAEARGHYESLKARGVTTTEPMDIADPAGTTTGDRSGGTPPPPEPSAALKAEQERLSHVDMLLRAYPQAEGLRGMLVGDPAAYTGNAIAKAVGDFISGRANGSLPENFGGAGTRPTVGAEPWDHERSALLDGLLKRTGRKPAQVDPKTGKPMKREGYTDGADAYRGMSLLTIGRMLLQRQGHAVDRMTEQQVAERMLQRSSQTSYDFPLLLGEFLNQSLAGVAAYMDRDWLACVKEVSATDFRTRHALQFGGANKLGKRKEGGEFPQAYFKESQESYKPEIEGLETVLTLEMILHDQLNAFGEQRMYEMYAQVESEREQFFALLVNNANMSDGQPLFSAAHKNISTVNMVRDDYASTTAALQALRIRMRSQVSATGMKTRIKPQTLLCPLEDYDNLFMRTSKPEIASTANTVGTANPNYGMAVLDSDELSAGTTQYIYSFGDPNIPGQAAIEAAWYLGNKDGNTFSEPHYGGLFVKYLVWSGFGLGVVGSHGVDRTTVVLPTP
jgi:hypothetical protein